MLEKEEERGLVTILMVLAMRPASRTDPRKAAQPGEESNQGDKPWKRSSLENDDTYGKLKWKLEYRDCKSTSEGIGRS
ncbi:hypothetical protein WISP_39567 [Willisornis vidua]|uniref:Uncharacterized protein n=1 Tax=Willisornis vidua TaxID=1566151 RepID=A0ABQ9DLX4_9PASS|nr:hypothetical protein WISP_39567 [Willisornis vidua]